MQQPTAAPAALPAHIDLPAHIEQSVQSIAQLHADHHENATPRERMIERITTILGRTDSIIVLTVALVGWIVLNLLAGALGFQPIDPPPFAGLTGVASVLAFYLVILILVSEQRADDLAERREQLTLELALLAERKTAKVIELLEAFRGEAAWAPARTDVEATEMARPADPSTVIAAIDASHPRRGD